MQADHEEDAVDYEGEEEEDDEHNVVGEQPIVEGIKGAGDSETSDDEEEGASSTNKQSAEAVSKKGGAGDSETESEGEEEDGEINKGKTSTSKKSAVSIMDKPLSAPREKPQNNNQGEGGNTRGNRWGERNTNNGRGAMKQQQSENVGVYIPPAKRRLLEEQRKAQEAEAAETSGGNKSTSSPTKQITPLNKQQESWTNLQRTINGTINRLSPSTLKPLIHQLFSEANLIKGRGILTKSILNASIGSMQYTSTYATLISVINSKLPEVGELLLTRAILSFRKGYKYRNMNTVSSTLSLLGHMFNQNIAHELLSLQILSLLLDGEPTDDSVDVAVSYMCIVGKQLSEVSPNGVHAIMERFRGLLHEGTIGRRGQYRIETLLKIKKGKFINYPTILPELDLVELDDQITFDSIGLDDDDLEYDEKLDVFHYDEEYDEKEEEWNVIKKEILGDDSDSSSDDESGSGSGSESSDDDEEEDVPDQQLIEPGSKKTVVIEDLTETDLVHLRRTIYLTIMSSATFEECTHKLAKMDIPPGKECELINMIIECCSQERTFLRYYGLVSGRFCLLNERWQLAFEEAFATQYNTIHRLETNKLRNVAKLFGHLLHTDSVSWSVLGCIHLNEDETTSSSRIFIKILVQEMAEAMGMVTLKQRFDTDNPEPDGELGDNGEGTASTALAVSNNNRQGYGHQQHQQEVSSREWFKGMFPKDNARNTRYAINFFTSIGLGPLTDGMREFLKNAPKLILAQAKAAAAREAAQKEKDDDESSVISTSSSDTSSASSSSSSSSSSYTSSSSSSYSSDSRYRRSKRSSRGRKRGRSRRRSRSYSSSSSSSSGSSDSSQDSHRRKKRKYSSKSSKRPSSRDSRRSSENENDNASKATSTGSKRRRSVSSSRGHKKRDRSSSRSHSPSARKESSRSSRNKDDGGDRKRSRRARSDSRSMTSSRK